MTTITDALDWREELAHRGRGIFDGMRSAGVEGARYPLASWPAPPLDAPPVRLRAMVPLRCTPNVGRLVLPGDEFEVVADRAYTFAYLGQAEIVVPAPSWWPAPVDPWARLAG